MISEEDKRKLKEYAERLAREIAISESELRRILEKAFKMKDKNAQKRYIEESVWNLIEQKSEDSAAIAEDKNGIPLPEFFVPSFIESIDETTKEKISAYATQFIKETEDMESMMSFYKPKIDKDTLREAKMAAMLPITAKSSVTNMKVLVSYLILDVMNKADLYLMRSRGIAGYIGVRMSTYDCPLCDSLCGYFIPIDIQVFPAHPRCVCGMIPVFV